MDFMEKEIIVGRTKVLVIRKNIKNMYLRVCPPEGDVRVTAPIGCTDRVLCTGENRLDHQSAGADPPPHGADRTPI